MAGPPCSMMVPASQSVHLRRSWRLEGTTSNYKTRLSNRIWKNFVSPLLISWAGFEHGCQGFSPKTDAKVLVPKRMPRFLVPKRMLRFLSQNGCQGFSPKTDAEFFALWESLGGCLELFGDVFFYIFLQNGFFSVFFGEVKEVVVRDHFINTVQDFPSHPNCL